jgi:hypothetical protein
MKPNIKKSEFPSLWEEGASDRAVIRDQHDFLHSIWEPQLRVSNELFGAFCFRRRGSEKMVQKFELLKDVARMRHLLRKYDRHSWDQYFSPNIYTRPIRKLGCVHLSRLGWCDVDAADPFAFDPAPSMIWQTSIGNTQALWFWDKPHSAKQASAFSKALTYRYGGDKGGSAANKLLRIPGSYNHKPKYDTPFIPLVHYDKRLINKRPQLLMGEEGGIYGAEPQLLGMNPHAHNPLDVLRKYSSKLSASARTVIRHDRVMVPDRSKWIFVMVTELFEAGATLDEIASVVWLSPYFRDKYGNSPKALERQVSNIVAKSEVAK